MFLFYQLFIYMLSRQRKDDPLCHVDRMVADAFQIFCDHEDVDEIFTRRLVLSYSTDYIILYFQKQLVNDIIFLDYGTSDLKIFFTKESTLSVTMEIAIFVISLI